MSNVPVTESTARHLISALERALEVLPSSNLSSSTPSVASAASSAPQPAGPNENFATNKEACASRPDSPPPQTWEPQIDGPARTCSSVWGEYTPSSTQPPKKKKKKLFSRIVVCLAGCDDDIVPLTKEKITLKANSIGETTIDFEVDGTAQHVQDQILSTFNKPELENGLELMVVQSKSRTKLEVVHSGPCQAKELKLLSSQRIYIRPMQLGITLTENSPSSSQATLICCYCGGTFLTSVMREHVSQCKESDSAPPNDAPVPPNDDPVPPNDDPFSPNDDSFSPHEVQLSTDTADRQTDKEPTDAGTTSNYEEIQDILHLLKEGYDSNSNTKDIVGAFRQLYLQGRSLNIPEGVEDFIEGDTYDISVSRLDIFNSVVDKLSAPSYNARLPLHVAFMGEKGQDLGGPRREFLRLGLASLYDRVTIGTAKSRELAADQAGYLDRMVYFVAGIVIGQCIMQDGPTPNFLSPTLIDRLLSSIRDNPAEAQFVDCLLQTGVNDLIKAFPQCRRMLHDEGTPAPLTANAVISSFNAEFAESGSNDWIHQELVYRHFVRYLPEVEAGQHRVDSDSDGDVIRLHHIYKFVSWLEKVPVCEWNPPLLITFTKQDVGIMGLGASTCTHHLQLPVPQNAIDPMPSRSILFDLFNKSIADEFFGKA